MNQNQKNSSGAALVIVLSFLVLISVIVVGFSIISSLEARSSKNYIRGTELEMYRQMALGEIISKIKAGTPNIGTNYYWVSAPGRIWRVAGADSVGATNALMGVVSGTNFYCNYTNMVSGYVDLFSTNFSLGSGPQSPGFVTTNKIVDLNSSNRNYKICPDPDPAGIGATDRQIPLVVNWINIPKDATRAPGPDNPIVARYAYWVDVENARLNLNDIGERSVGWDGISSTELDASALDGISSADLYSFRQTNSSGMNTRFFRRVEDLRQVGVSSEVIRSNSFYLTAAGRNIEVDNAGRIPINLSSFNGNPTNYSWPTGYGAAPAGFTNNHPMATYTQRIEDIPFLSGMPYASPSGGAVTTNYTFSSLTASIQDEAEEQIWIDRSNNVGDNGQLPSSAWVYSDFSAIDPDWPYEVFGVSNPQDISFRSNYVEYLVASGSLLASPNYMSFGTNANFVEGYDWLPRRLVAGPLVAPSYDYDEIFYQRLTQGSDKWMVVSTETDANGSNGKYTWNEMAQIFANINQWRLSPDVEYNKGSVSFPSPTTNPEYPISQSSISDIRPSGVSFNKTEQSITRGSTTYNVNLNQNIGVRTKPYLNEVGISITRSATQLNNITVHLEFWNPTAPFRTNSKPYHLMAVPLMPEVPVGGVTWPGGIVTTMPQDEYSAGANPESSWGSTPNPQGEYSNPERFHTFYFRNNEVNPGGFWTKAGWYGSLWSDPGVQNFTVKGGEVNATNQYGGGRMGVDQNVSVAQISKFQNRWHAPVIHQGGGTTGFRNNRAFYVAILQNAHLVDWRIPQHMDLGLFPACGYHNRYLANSGEVGGGIRVSDATNSGRINMALAVGVSVMDTNSYLLFGSTPYLGDVDVHSDIPSLAAGPRGNGANLNKISAFYDILPHPRLNPKDENNASVWSSGDGNRANPTGLPQTKWLPFLGIQTLPLSSVTVSREVDDPRCNDRSAFVDFTRQNSSEYNNLVNTYDANDWGPVLTAGTLPYSNVGNHSLRSVNTADFNYGRAFPFYELVNEVNLGGGSMFEKSTYSTSDSSTYPDATSLGGNLTGYLQKSAIIGPGEPGAMNSFLTNSFGTAWNTNGASWSSVTATPKPMFSGWGDGDGDLTSQIVGETDFQNPAELGYVHSGRPWRTLRFNKALTNSTSFDVIGSVPDWALYDIFQGSLSGPDNYRSVFSRSSNKALGQVKNPRRSMLTLNPSIHTAEPQTNVLERVRLRPYKALVRGLVSDEVALAKMIYSPTTDQILGYDGYGPGTGDRFGIPGVIDSAGEICEVLGRMPTNMTVIASKNYSDAVFKVWGTPSINTFTNTGGNTDSSMWVASGAKAIYGVGWAGAGSTNIGGTNLVTLASSNSAGPKEVLRGIGQFLTPRSSHFRAYVCVQTVKDVGTVGTLEVQDTVQAEQWKEILIERTTSYDEGSIPNYVVVWDKSL